MKTSNPHFTNGIPVIVSIFFLYCILGAAWVGGSTAIAALPAAPLSDSSAATRTPEPAILSHCWSVVSSPDVGTSTNALYGVAAVSEADVWAVGDYSTATGSQALLLHWDGNMWNIAPGPVITGDTHLRGITEVSPDDVWAVGDSGSQTLTLHWDGSLWSVIPSPNVDATINFLEGVSAVSADDVWAVGYSGISSLGSQTLTLHWDGSVWSIVSSPDVDVNSNTLHSVAAVSTDDVWAVGNYISSSAGSKMLILHWDGSAWSVSPGPLSGISFLTGVSAISANDVWAVGYNTNDEAGYKAMMLHWDGSVWNFFGMYVEGSSNYLYGVSALSTDDVWAVGYYGSHTMILHWDGHYWDLNSSPEPAPGKRLYGVAALSSTDVWAVGNSGSSTLTERYIECQIECVVSFEDVPEGSTFYTYIQCMACQGLIDGYPCGTTGEPCNNTGDPYFRPSTNITRGQIAKIASNAAGFNESTGAQQYEDVPVGSTFFDFIWRLSSRGFVSGYNCGGAGEPCVGPDNLPYFRPNANITRGQIAKIDSNTAGYNDTSGAQQYQDVVPGSTFYDFIWRLSDRGLVSGYTCGGAGEPCGPDRLPYFRPSAHATRGQASKIVSNTFFPNCSP